MACIPWGNYGELEDNIVEARRLAGLLNRSGRPRTVAPRIGRQPGPWDEQVPADVTA